MANVFTIPGSFRHIKQRVLWKFEDNSLSDIPSNVLIKTWMPQNDILAHPNVKLFISHGGLFSTMESVNQGVPLLIVPFFGDQHRNGRRIEMAGYGKVVAYDDLSEPLLTDQITEMLSSNRYFDRARQLQLIWKDNIVQPMDEFIWWIEHVAKFRGAKHLKSHAIHLSLFSYLLIDVFAATFVILLIIVSVIIFGLRRLCCSAKNKKDQSSKKLQ